MNSFPLRSPPSSSSTSQSYSSTSSSSNSHPSSHFHPSTNNQCSPQAALSRDLPLSPLLPSSFSKPSYIFKPSSQSAFNVPDSADISNTHTLVSTLVSRFHFAVGEPRRQLLLITDGDLVFLIRRLLKVSSSGVDRISITGSHSPPSWKLVRISLRLTILACFLQTSIL